ncbi:hypothetical protein K525DRAFT_282472 [Schizophyllum commune Loenen D]|nr:hypothetical protein K525DRAFT_282472 [Schizophyllum commune Loenen D]
MSTSEDVTVASPSLDAADTGLFDVEPARLDEKNDKGTGSSDGEPEQIGAAGEDAGSVHDGGNTTASTASVDTLDHKLRALRSCIRYRIPFVHDKLPIKAGHCIDLAHPTYEQLCHLEQACAPTTFGRNQEDVLDETYRKAGKMDNADFCVNYTPPDGVLGLIREELFEKSECQLRYELYKLNVYGKDSFFKPHKDTPRGTHYTGTLVMIFPAPHEGGQLVFTSGKNEWTVDAASEIFHGGAPHVVFVAFYGDVTHEVLPVLSGHRVTLTWNIFVAWPHTPIAVPREVLDYDVVLKNALADLLADERLLPNGGYLAFGLRYQYPDNSLCCWTTSDLKGGDAMIKRACEALGVEPMLRLLYGGYSHEDIANFFGKRDDGYFLAYTTVSESCCHYVSNLADAVEEEDVLRDAGTAPRRNGYHEGTETVWVTCFDQRASRVEDHYVAYGNEASVDTAYASYALFIKVEREPKD